MRRSQMLGRTERQAPADGDSAGHHLLVRGGYIQQLAAGLYSYLPLGQKVKARVEAILRAEMDAIDGQEFLSPVLQPADLWRETGRLDAIGPELVRFDDRAGRGMVLAMTHEEVVADLLRGAVTSYRQLPLMIYQIQTKVRDEGRARGGLMRVREFTMKDAYSAHASVADLDAYYPRVYTAYERIFQRCGLDVVAVEADAGMMGGTATHEFMYLSPIGEDDLALCDTCDYKANVEAAAFRKDEPAPETARPVSVVETPGMATIAALTAYLGIPASRTAKATFFMDGDRLIFAVVRGDMNVAETKLARVVNASSLRPATLEDLAGTGIVPGYASPIGVSGAVVVVDDLVAASPNLLAGANRFGVHLQDVNIPRDYTPDLTADIAAVYEGAGCPLCGGTLHLTRGVEVGHTFKLGTRYSAALGARFQDEDGALRDIVMASYGIGVGRLIACIAEAHRDEKGLIWPAAVAPFDVYLVGLDRGQDDVREETDKLYADLRADGVAVLYDDRDERAGVKFNDADLLGLPLRVTVSRRTLADGVVELTPRIGGEKHYVACADALAIIAATVKAAVEASGGAS